METYDNMSEDEILYQEKQKQEIAKFLDEVYQQAKEENVPSQIHDIVIEQTIIGSIITYNELVTKAIKSLKPDYFYESEHKIIFNAITELFKLSQPITILTICKQLERSRQLDEIGGSDYVNYLLQQAEHPFHFVFYVESIIENYTLRQIATQSKETLDEISLQSANPNDILIMHESTISQLLEINTKNKESDFVQDVDDVIQELDSIKPNQEVSGIATGFQVFDSFTGGLQNSDLIILAGRPGQGKTSLALNIFYNVAITTPAAFFSLEMSKKQLIQRLISRITGINLLDMRKGTLQSYEKERYHGYKIDELKKAKIFIDDTPAITLLDLKVKAKQLKRDKDIKLLIVDYIQIMREPSAESREREIGIISGGLKALAKELDIPVIALSQLNRNCENRADKRPLLADFRESGTIEQDTDLAVFIHRPEFYKILEFEDKASTIGKAEIIIAKARSGPTGDFRLDFESHITTFKNYTTTSTIPIENTANVLYTTQNNNDSKNDNDDDELPF
jgi:replicative DNA helicase